MNDPFHSGEREVQEAVGVRGVALLNGRTIDDRLPDAASSFVARLPYCVLGWADVDQEVWAWLATNPSGVAAVDAGGRAVRVRPTVPPPRSVSRFGLLPGQPLGTLFIDLGARRRLRVSGVATRVTDTEITLAIRQANGLCSKYIQRREAALPPDAAVVDAFPEATAGTAMPDEVIAMVTGADTAFVASAVPGESANVSHRGGAPGFIDWNGEAFCVPDYPGNNMFNTLGNFARHGRAGLTVVDFATNRQVQLSGDVSMTLVGSMASVATGGTGRSWTLRVRRWALSRVPLAPVWSPAELSRFNPPLTTSETTS